MDKFSGKIGVIGAGALGALYGARMARAGYDVHFLMRSDADTVRREGLSIRSAQGDFTIRPPVSTTPEEMGVCDLVLVGLKATDNGALPSILPPLVGPNTLILTLQNGLGNEDEIARVLAPEHPDIRTRILGGIAFLCSNRIAPGVIHHIEYGHVRIAEFTGPAQPRTHLIGKLFTDAELGCVVSDSLMHIRWEKLVWNIPFNGLGVGAEDADTRVVLDDPELRAVARGLMEETILAATADGVTITPDFPDTMMSYSEGMGPYKSSMQLDYANGRPLEVEPILGEPCRRALAAGLAVPRLQMLYGIVRRRDRLNRR